MRSLEALQWLVWGGALESATSGVGGLQNELLLHVSKGFLFQTHKRSSSLVLVLILVFESKRNES